jgi:RNA-directed DNA polymerase
VDASPGHQRMFALGLVPAERHDRSTGPGAAEGFCGGALTIGAPTSPSLSNSILYTFDTRVTSACSEVGVTYSRYADDLYLSSKSKGVLGALESAVGEVIRQLPYPRALKVNNAKTWHVSKRRRRTVTGLVLTADGGVSVGRKVKRKIRSLLHGWETLTVEERRSVAGYLSYLRGVEPDFLNRLILKFGAERVQRAQRGEG